MFTISTSKNFRIDFVKGIDGNSIIATENGVKVCECYVTKELGNYFWKKVNG